MDRLDINNTQRSLNAIDKVLNEPPADSIGPIVRYLEDEQVIADPDQTVESRVRIGEVLDRPSRTADAIREATEEEIDPDSDTYETIHQLGTFALGTALERSIAEILLESERRDVARDAYLAAVMQEDGPTAQFMRAFLNRCPE